MLATEFILIFFFSNRMHLKYSGSQPLGQNACIFILPISHLENH